MDSAEPGRFPLAAGLPVATGQFGLAQTERGREEEERKRRGRGERKASVTVLQRKQKKKQMTWRSGRGR